MINKDPRGAIQFSDHYTGEGIDLFKGACDMGLEGIVSKRASASYRSGPSRFWLKTKNTVESELVLLGTDYDNEGKPIAYLGREIGGRLQFAGTAFVTLSGAPRSELQARIEKVAITKAVINLPKVRQPQWVSPVLLIRVRHLKGGDTLRHASVRGLAD